MAMPTAVNGQVTDAVSKEDSKTPNEAPALATGELMMAASQALANAAHNAPAEQQDDGVTAQAALTQGVDTLLNLDAAAGEVGTGRP